MRPSCLSAALAAAILLPAAPAAAVVPSPFPPTPPITNLVLNPGFERGDPGNWSCEHHAIGWPVHSGGYALDGVTSDNSTGRCTQTVAVTPGARLRLTAWMKGRHVQLGVTGKGSATSAAFLPSWSLLSHDFQVGAGEETVEVYVSGWYAQGRYAVDDVSVIGAPTRVPGVPTGVIVRGTTSRAAALSWAPAARAVGYRVYAGDGGLLHDTFGPATGASVVLGQGQEVALTVVAYNAAGVSAPAEPVTMTTPPDGASVPYAPRAVFVSAGPEGSLWTAWEAVQTATDGYAVYVDGRFHARTTGPALRIEGLARSRTYQVTVTAFNGNGESPRSYRAYGTTLPAGAVPPPA